MTNKMETDSQGIPVKGPYPANPPVAVLYTVFNSVLCTIFGTLTYFTIVKGNEAANAKHEIIAKYDLEYLYFTAIILKLGQFVMGIICGQARKQSKVHPPDQHVYKVKGAEGSKLGYVLMEYEGDHGKFNRAQRAVQNYNETFPQTALYIVLGGFVYPKEVMVLAAIYSLSRVMSAIGYTNSTEGRMGGFIFSNVSVVMIEALVAITAYRTLKM
mmetsp:Transcript_10939/g.20441  ORF Transcript_10939/g.20441 Transcript_10939/m.20441 type:complete len:214 (+) Transcript_10939:305-946(+)